MKRRVRYERHSMYHVIKYMNGLVLKKEVKMKNRWKEYFESFVNVKDKREVEEDFLRISAVRNEFETISS